MFVSIGKCMIIRNDSTKNYWYVGVEGTIPIGLSTFSSFGRYHNNVGYGGGLYGGYQFNPFISAELEVYAGHTNMYATTCCSFYWLGADGERYNAPLSTGKSYSYKDIVSSVFLIQSSLKFNIDILQLFKNNDALKWQFLISPAVSLVNSKAKVQTIE